MMRATVPPTSPTRYLTGRPALNLLSEGGTGDWHFVETFGREGVLDGRLVIMGEGCATDTTPYLGAAGIYDCTALLDEQGIPHQSTPAYAADHARAIVDLVLAQSLRGNAAEFVILDDWMPRSSDKQKVFGLLATAKPLLPAAARVLVATWEQDSE